VGQIDTGGRSIAADQWYVLDLEGEVAGDLLHHDVAGRRRLHWRQGLDDGTRDQGLGRDACLGRQTVLHRFQEIVLQEGEQQQARKAHGHDNDGQVAKGQARAQTGDHSSHQLVAHAADRLDGLGAGGGPAQPGPQPLDGSVNHAQVAIVIITPHLLHQLLAAQDLAGVAGQGVEQVELQGGEVQGNTAPGSLVAGRIDPPRAGAARRGAARS